MAVPLSSADAAVIEHTVPLDPEAIAGTAAHSGVPVEQLYDVRATAEALVYRPGTTQRIEPPLERVALQFPDEALVDSVPVYHALNSALRQLAGDAVPRLYILADTSYGACCVDEVAAHHVQAEVVVHYGHACLSPTAKLPALYVFPKAPIDAPRAAHGLLAAARELELTEQPPAAVLLTYDVAYEHAVDEVYRHLLSEWPLPNVRIVTARVDTAHAYAEQMEARAAAAAHKDEDSCGGEHRAPHGGQHTCTHKCASCAKAAEAPSGAHNPTPGTTPSLIGTGRRVTLPAHTALADTATLYLGGESRALTHLLLALGPTYRLASYDPKAQRARVETGQTNRLLMRRYALIQKARDASVVGLVVGSLGVHNYLPLLKHLRRILTSRISQRKVYTMSVGKLNPAKLANFQEVDVFVLVACPENSLIDSREFVRPVVTPWEMLLAVEAHSGREVAWTGHYVLALDEALRRAQHSARAADEEAADEAAADEDRPHYSFATGAYVSRTRYGDGPAGAAPADPLSRALERVSLEPHEVAVRDPASGQLTRVLQSASKAHLENRSWAGLDEREGSDRSYAPLEEGMAGFAQRYRAADANGRGPGQAGHPPEI